MKYYAVLDTNILVSAMLNMDSVPGRVVAEALIGNLIPVLNEAILAEYTEVLQREKFRFDLKKIRIFLDDLVERGIFIAADATEIELPDSDDAVFYAVASEARKDADTYLVTGNLRHFPKESYIVSPREMLTLLQG